MSLEDVMRRISAENQEDRLAAERRHSRILSTLKPDGPRPSEVVGDIIRELEAESGEAHGTAGEDNEPVRDAVG